jgi:biopolymer transport protein ExbB
MSRVTLLELMHDGGWVMWILLLFSVAAVAVGVQRALVVRRARGKAAPLLAFVGARLGRDESPLAVAESCREREGAVGRLLAAGLARAEAPDEALEAHLEAVALRELRRLGHGLAVLAAVATTAPLLGFLGTVTGMMASFGSIVDNGMARPDLVALGIKEALTTTAAGLIVAVPAQLAYQALRTRVERIEGELENAANGLLDLLHRRPA